MYDVCVSCVYAAIAKKREDILKTRKQRLVREQQPGCLVVCGGAQAIQSNCYRSTDDESGEASSDDHGSVHIHHATETF